MVHPSGDNYEPNDVTTGVYIHEPHQFLCLSRNILGLDRVCSVCYGYFWTRGR